MTPLIQYLNIKSNEAGHRLTMSELREVIKKDSLEYERITDDLKSLYRKTYQFEDMQKVLNSKELMQS
jgi:hypothetical protein